MSSPGWSMPASQACLHVQRINRESERVVFKLKMDWHLNVSIKVAFETGSATLECSVFVWSKGLVCPGCLNNHTWYSSMVSFSGPGWKLEKVPPPLSFFRSCLLPNGPGFSAPNGLARACAEDSQGPGLRSRARREARGPVREPRTRASLCHSKPGSVT